MDTPRNVILISLDEVRPDHLGCYGYKRIATPGHDQIAREGIKFETCISSADFTPVAMASVITGKNPNSHGMREPYQHLTGPTIASILEKKGYATAGFVGNGLLSAKHGYGRGFDFWDEPTEEESVSSTEYGIERGVCHYDGNYWVERFFSWLEGNYEDPFFMWGHFFETHEGAEEALIRRSLLDEASPSDFGYYDAKIEMADEKLVSRLLRTLRDLKIDDRTILVVMSDHGTNLGEHAANPIPWRGGEKIYPQHTTMYDHDLRVSLLVRADVLPKGTAVRGLVRSIDLVPSLLDLLHIETKDAGFDGESWASDVASGAVRGREAYSEDLFEPRGTGAVQSIRTESTKFIRNLTQGTEEYYDLESDPSERDNRIGDVGQDVLVPLRAKLNRFLFTAAHSSKAFSASEKEAIARRLRALGYVK